MQLLSYIIKNRLEQLKKEKETALVFKAREYQQEIINIFNSNTYNYFLLCWARRLGKDLLALSLACSSCINKANSIVYYVFPTMKQGKMMILEGYSNNKKRIIEEVININSLLLPLKSDKLYHSDNTLRFKNGSIIYFVGSQDVNTKVGGNIDLLVISEMALIANKDLLLYLVPSVTNVNGKIILVSTPRFGSEFNRMIKEKSQGWYINILNAYSSKAVDEQGNKIYTDKKLEDTKLLMSKAKFKQDIECDINVANETSIYSESLEQAEFVNNINIANKKMYVSEDLGINDSTALVFVVDNTVIHHYHSTDKATIHYIDYIKTFMQKNNIRDVEIILPHDARNRHDAIDYLTSRKEAYESYFNNVVVLSAYDVNKTIEVTRHSIEQHKIKFLNNANVLAMIDLIKSYEWKIDNKTGENLRTPIHGRGLSASNTCDALEYFIMRTKLEDYNKNIMSLEWGNYLD